MIEWYNDGEIGIYFSITPHVDMRYPIPYMCDEEKKEIEAKPFINLKKLEVKLVDFEENKYKFSIPANYTWDGASIPRMFWRLIGSKTDPRFLIPSLIHDVLCENHKYVNNDRYFADRVFERLLYVSGVPAFNRWLMFHSVDNFQKFCGWNKAE